LASSSIVDVGGVVASTRLPTLQVSVRHQLSVNFTEKFLIKLETCIDDERQFKTAKRPQAPSDASVRKRFFCDNFVIFRHRLKRIAFFGISEFF